MEKTFYTTKEQHVALLKTWKGKKEHTAAQHVIYNILRSKPADHGFVEKYADILPPGDPRRWKAYREAVIEAKWFLTKTAYNYDAKRDAFKRLFGFDLPEDLVAKFEGIQK